MSEESSGMGKKGALGIVGATIAVVSIFWFALRPRLRHKKDATD